jgi:hypothetical protein
MKNWHPPDGAVAADAGVAELRRQSSALAPSALSVLPILIDFGRICRTILSQIFVIKFVEQFCRTILSNNFVEQFCRTILSNNFVALFCLTLSKKGICLAVSSPLAELWDLRSNPAIE